MRLGLRFPLCAALFCVPVSAASAAPPAPFGHACTPRDGALFCPTADDAARVPSFDGVPLDVDVWLPATGDGPFPTVAMLHGFGGSKLDFQGPKPAGYNAMELARKGSAVVLPSARGFGRSCGVPDSRTADPVGCARGWIHLADQRYEARDVQWLLAKLVDQLVARPDELGVTGISYGAGTTMQLALLAGRIRRPDGVTESWQSPDGVPLHIAAAWARWPWTDLADALQRNGRLGLDTYASPVGVEIEAYVNALYTLANTSGFVAPLGADPGADLTGWNQRLAKGEPYGADVRSILQQIHAYHGVLGLPIDQDHAAAHPVGLDRRSLPGRPGPAHLRPAAPEEQDRAGGAAARRPRPRAGGQPRGRPGRPQRPGPGLLRGPPAPRRRLRPGPGQRDRLHADLSEGRHPRRWPVQGGVFRGAGARGARLPPQGRPARDLQRRRRRALAEALAAERRPVQGRRRRHRARDRGGQRALARRHGDRHAPRARGRRRDGARRAARGAPVGRQPGHRPPAPGRPRRRAPALAQARQLRAQRQRLQVRAPPTDPARAAGARQPDLPRGERHVQRDGEQAAGGAPNAGAPARALA